MVASRLDAERCLLPPGRRVAPLAALWLLVARVRPRRAQEKVEPLVDAVGQRPVIRKAGAPLETDTKHDPFEQRRQALRRVGPREFALALALADYRFDRA